MEDLTEKPCKCGGTMGEILGFVERSTDGENVPYRRLWWCQECNAEDYCTGREMYVEWPPKKSKIDV